MVILFSFLFAFISFLSGLEFYVITTEYSPRLGMFAAANQVLGQLSLFETGQLGSVVGLTVDFREYGLYYDPRYGPNWWTYYFENIDIGNKKNVRIVYPNKEQYGKAWNHRYWMPRALAAQIVKKYIHVKPHILEKVDAFAMRFFKNCYVIGIHYRGTDKQGEAPRVSYARVFEEIDQRLPQDGRCCLFIATDEIEFLEAVKTRYPAQTVALDVHRARSNQAGVHFIYQHNYDMGEEALMDALLLSRCDVLIRTSSNLSLWSTYFNPELPVVLLNQRHQRTLESE